MGLTLCNRFLLNVLTMKLHSGTSNEVEVE